jgi:ABC-type transport system substrate-binding protein
MRKYSLFFISLLITAFVIVGAGCKKNTPSTPSDESDSSLVIEEPTSSTKFPATTLEYYLQSYRDHVLPKNISVDKKKLKAVIVATGEDQVDKKVLTVNFYTDTKWSDGKEHVFYIEEVKEGKSTYYGQFSSTISKLVTESGSVKTGALMGDFFQLKGIKINK